MRYHAGILHVENGLRAGDRVGAISLQFDGIHAASVCRIDQSFGLVEGSEVAADLGDDVATVSRIVLDHYNFARI